MHMELRFYQQHLQIVLGMINYRHISGRNFSVQPVVGLQAGSVGTNKCLSLWKNALCIL
jgi:hypothetical protein